MNTQFEELSKLYKNKKKENNNLFIFNNPKNIMYHSIIKGRVMISIKKMKADNKYLVMLFVSENDNILLNCPIYNTNLNPILKYSFLKKDLRKLTLIDLINKHYKSMKKNLLSY